MKSSPLTRWVTAALLTVLAQLFEVDTLFLGLQRRMEQLEQDSAMLEREDDGEMYGAVVLRIIELELAEILQLMAKLNSTLHAHQQLGESTSSQVTPNNKSGPLLHIKHLC